jgi:8-oxo-dGTP diphosphatase
MLARTREGHEILAFLPHVATIPAEDAHIPLTWTLIIARHQGQVIWCYNPTRGQWETPGGGIEPGESLAECAARELREESSQIAQTLTFRGIFKICLAPDSRLEYGGLFSAEIDEIRPFIPNEETNELRLATTLEELPGQVSDVSRLLMLYAVS